MYSSLDSIDIVTDTVPPLLVQTDHRTPDEIAAAPEISVLFALVRINGARRYGAEHASAAATVVYACAARPPALLIEALAAAGAALDVAGGERQRLAPIAITPVELADRAFAALARRVSNRVGLTDPAAVLRAVEAETLADPPDREDDEPGYWMRVLELAAVAAEIVRARDGGHWVEDTEYGDIPFGFETTIAGSVQRLFPTNRAARLIEDGAGESMFLMLNNVTEARAHTDESSLPILPSLRARSEALGMKCIWRPLLDKANDADLPVIAYGTDSPTAFGLLMETRPDDRDELHRQALANLVTQDVGVHDLELAGLTVLVVTDSFFATDKLLDRAFMKTLHSRLRASTLGVIVPRRGLMFVTNAAPADPRQAMAILAALADKEFETSRKISKAVLLVQDGGVVGHAAFGFDPNPGDEPVKKPGLLRRLFGRS